MEKRWSFPLNDLIVAGGTCPELSAATRVDTGRNRTQSFSSIFRLIFRGEPIVNISYDSYRVFYYAAKYRSFSQASGRATTMQCDPHDKAAGV